MRSILAFAMLLLGLSSAAPEPQYSPLFDDYTQATNSDDATSPIEIESAIDRSDRLPVASALSSPAELFADVIEPDIVLQPLTLVSASPDVGPSDSSSVKPVSTTRGTETSLGDLCNALYTSAQDNDLPVPFFANLIWQESRLRADDVSKKGAQGIAQFMPETAVEKGLSDPFDPMQALPASARFLRELRLQFGNLGFVAAAYNAGAQRVIEWLEHRNSLPRETRNYVMRVTGLSVDAWRSKPVNNDAVTFVPHLPCRSLPAFANVEQAQLEETQLAQAKAEQAKLDTPPAKDVSVKDVPVKGVPVKHAPVANAASAPAGARKHDQERPEARSEHRQTRHEGHEARSASHELRMAKREAAHISREKRKSA